jgi:hypothetical protein
MDLSGLLPIAGGVYGFLLANGTLPKNPKDPEKMALWRKKFGGTVKIISPIVVVYGVLLLLGILR